MASDASGGPGRLERLAPSLVRDFDARRTEARREAALVEPVRPFIAQQERRLRRHVGLQTAACGNGDLLPGRAGRPAGARVDQVVLDRSAAEPATRRGATRGEAAVAEGQ